MIVICRLAFVIVLLLVPATNTDAAAVICNTARAKVLASAQSIQTTSQVYVAVPEATVRFNQSTAGCVLVQFYAEYDGGGSVYLRAVMDGATVGLPSEAIFGSVINLPNTHAASFVFPSIATGTHSVKIEFRSISGSAVNLFHHTTIVSLAP